MKNIKNIIVVFFLMVLSCFGYSQDVVRNSYYGEKEISAPTSITLKSGFVIPSGSTARIFIGPSSSTCEALSVSPTPTINYVSTYTAFVPGIKQVNEFSAKTICEAGFGVQYFDGFSRPIQAVESQAGVNKKDVASVMEYDRFGRQPKNYLPYVSSDIGGAFKSNALDPNSGLFSYYNNVSAGNVANPFPYSESRFDKSPLNQIEEKASPGSPWHIGSGNTVKVGNLSNDNVPFNANDRLGSRMVSRFKAVSNSTGEVIVNREIGDKKNYADTSLYVTIFKDENWKNPDGCLGTIENYYDKAGKLILKRSYNLIIDNKVEMLSTYYVYDQYDNLCYVFPPNFEGDSDNTIDQERINNLCFQYRYDYKKRVIERKSPDKGWEYFIYNKLGQMVLSQDAIQRNKSPQEWIFQKYDSKGNSIIGGIYQHSGSLADANLNAPANNHRKSLQTTIKALNDLWERKDMNQPDGYTNVSFPTEGILNSLVVNYYDNYDIPGLPSTYQQNSAYSNQTLGFLVASKRAVLNNPSHKLWTVLYYNENGQNVKTLRQHYKSGEIIEGNYDETLSQFSFVGQLVTSVNTHFVKGQMKLKTTDVFDYDEGGRLVQTKQSINNNSPIILSRNVYNSFGQLATKKLHSEDEGVSFLQSLDYSYNERGWLTKTSSDLFKFQLDYQNPAAGGTPQYNGTISSQRWGNSTLNESVAIYQYDKIYRLLSGVGGGMQEKDILYDKVGNIQKLTRDGNVITYDYNEGGINGNKLLKVSGNSLYTNPYSYDLNGNATNDGSKNNIGITYNLLNQPQNITGSQTITYTYDADGSMLGKSSVATGTKEYISGIEYGTNNGSYDIDAFTTAEGKAMRMADGTYRYQYDLTDHLGNIRLSLDKDPISGKARRIQQDDYYTFGKRKAVAPVSLNNRYLYNGKELQEELNEYDYGARFYNPEIGRWNAPDPHAESYSNLSPYNYVANNPIGFTDPNGMDMDPWIKPINGTQRDAVWWTGTDPSKMPAGWEFLGNEDYKFQGGWLKDTEIVGKVPSSIVKRNTAFAEMYQKKYDAYKRNLGWFETNPSSAYLTEQTAKDFHERYYAHNEIDPFSGRGRVIGLEDANWIIDIGVGGIYGLIKSGGTVALSEGVAAGVAKGRTPSLGSLKNMSGSLDEAAALARTQPYGANTNVFRRVPYSSQDVQALTEAQAGMGRNLNLKLGDTRYTGWEKWHHSVGVKGSKSVVHYLRNPQTGFLTDFKFK